MPNLTLTLTLALILGACAATPPKPASSSPPVAAANSRLVCTSEKPTGSIMAVRVCRTPEELEQQRQHDMNAMDKAKSIQSAQGQVQAGR